MAKKDSIPSGELDSLFRRPTLPVKKKSPKAKAKTPAPKPTPQDSSDPKTQTPPQKVSTGLDSLNTFTVDLESIRKSQSGYTGIRLKKDLFERLSKIAEQEQLKSTNRLISRVLEAFCEGYGGGKV